VVAVRLHPSIENSDFMRIFIVSGKSIRRAALLTFLAMPMVSVGLEAQSPSTLRLTTPAATLESPLMQIADLVELSDGSLLLLDPLDAIVHRVDPQLRTSAQVGRRGGGPGEYDQPTALIALPDGRSLIVHTSESRGTIVDATGRTVGDWTPVGGLQGCRLARPLLGVRSFDVHNRAYAEAQPIRVLPGGKREVSETSAIERWRSPCVRDTVALVESADAVRYRGGMVIGQAVVGRPGVTPPFQASSQWIAFADGRVAIVSAEPYGIRYIDPNGSQKAHLLSHQPVAVTDGHKAAWRAYMQRPQKYVTAVVGEGAQRVVGRGPLPPEPDAWPRVLPPFLAGALAAHADGTLWIQRTTPADAAPTFDVVDRNGTLVRRVILRPRSRIVGLGQRSVYVVRTDEDEVEHLERFAIPWITSVPR